MSKGNLSFGGWRSRDPLVIDRNDPQAVGVCDGCGWWCNHSRLFKHMVYRGGATPVWDGMLFCSKCMDVPNPAPQFSRLTLAPDPVPPPVPVIIDVFYRPPVSADPKFRLVPMVDVP